MIFDKIMPFYDDGAAQLQRTLHFGVLGNVLDSTAMSRLDYVHAHCQILRQLKIAAPGLGLGRHKCFPDDPRWKSLQALTGVEICQAWSVLLNAGHLFGTFATERGLLFYLDKNLGARNKFIHEGTAFDHCHGNELRPFVQSSLDRPRLHDFFYLTALWRLRENGVSSLEGAARDQARLLVKAFLQTPKRLKNLVAIFRRTRQLVYLTIHNGLTERGLDLKPFEDTDLRALFPTDVLADDEWYTQGRWSVFAAIDRHDSANLFASARSASAVLSHVEQVKQWFHARDDKGLETNIDDLFTQPADWEQSTNLPYAHFATINVPSVLDWMGEVRLWLRDGVAKDPWANSNFLLTPNPVDDTLQVDLYSGPSGISIPALRHTVVQLTRAYSVGTPAQSRGLWKSTTRLIATVFSTCLDAGYEMRVRPALGQGTHIGYASAGDSYEFVRGMAKRFIAACTDPNRQTELRQTIAVGDALGYWRVPAVIVLGAIEIVQFQDDRDTLVTDIDGLMGFFIDDKLKWFVVESKARTQGGGAAQLRAGIVKALKCKHGDVQTLSVGQQKVWFMEVTSPAELSVDRTPECGPSNSRG